MEETLKDKIQEALKEACKPDPNPNIQLEIAHGRFAGLVLSDSFRGQSPSERQDRIWEQFDRRLTHEERVRISFIAADTPEEYAALTEA